MRRRVIGSERVNTISEDMLVRSGVPERYWNARLESIKGEPSFKDLFRKFVVGIHRFVNRGSGLRLLGEFNTGKTCLAVVALKEVLQRGGTVFFLSAKDVPKVYYEDATAEGMWDEGYRISTLVKTVHLLVLDDLGAEGFDPKGAAGAELERVLRTRYETVGSIIITTNLSQAAIQTRYTSAVVSLLGRITERIIVSTDQWKRGGKPAK